MIALAVGSLSLLGVSVAAAATAVQDPGSTPADVAAAQRVMAEREAREVRLQAPDMQEERARRRTAYRGLSDSEAVDRARRDYPRLLDEAPFPGPQFRSGANVEYLSDRVARVRQPGRDRDSLAMSALPLRVPDQDGRRVPVDLALAEGRRGFAPKVPLVEASFGGRLSDGFSVGRDPLRLTLRDSVDRSAQRVGDRLFYANVQTDTDLVAFPTPTGIELVTMLRSIDSPERQLFDLELPAGASARETGRGDVEISRGGELIARVLAPFAVDAQGQSVELKLSLVDGRLQLDVPHRDRDYAYPIAVDPIADSYWAWYLGNRDFAGWVPETKGAGKTDQTGIYGPGLYGYLSGGLTFAAGDYGRYRWQAPGNSYITSVNFGYVYVFTNYDNSTWPMSFAGIWDTNRGTYAALNQPNGSPWYLGDTAGNYYGKQLYDGGPGDRGNQALFGIISWTGGTRPIGKEALAYLGGAILYVEDSNAPEVVAGTLVHSNETLASGWNDAGTGNTTVAFSDPGLGVQWFQHQVTEDSDAYSVRDIDVPPTNGGTGRCVGDHISPCPIGTPVQTTFNYNLAALREGHNNLKVGAYDQFGHFNTVTWPVRVDRSNPQVALSGPLYDRRGGDTGTGSFRLDVHATDGDASTDATARSGVRLIDVFLDGERVAGLPSQECDTPARGSCALDTSWTFNTDAHPGGPHLVEVVAVDQLGHSTTASFEFSSPCCFGAETVWGTGHRLGGENVLFGDVNGDGYADAIENHETIGDVRVALSSGAAFGTLSGWGSWTTLNPSDPGVSLHLADVNGDGKQDLVERDSTSLATPPQGNVYVGLSTGTSFQTRQVWGTTPFAPTEFGDVSGDGKADALSRDPAASGSGELRVATSTGNSFATATSWGSIASASPMLVADADGDEVDDVIGRNGDTGTVVVALSRTTDFAAAAAWGTVNATAELRAADVNSDGRADLATRQVDGAMSVAPSTESAFRAPTRWGTWSNSIAFNLADVDGNGSADLAGRELLGPNARVALSYATPPVDPTDETQPDPAVQYTTDDGSDADPLALTASRPRKLVLASQDDNRLLYRRRLFREGSQNFDTDPFSSEPSPVSPGKTMEETAVERISLIYRRLREAGFRAVRFNVQWGLHENAQYTDNTNRWYWEKLDKAVTLAKQNGFIVYFTLTGAATADLDCDFANPPVEGRRPPYNSGGRGCVKPTGQNPDPPQFAEFVRQVVTRYKDRVRRYAIWNEPNSDSFLRLGDDPGGPVAALRYRALYNAARAAAREVDSNVSVWFGEVSSFARNRQPLEGGTLDGDGRPNQTSAVEFIQRATEGSIRTEGIAWHPYQHRIPPRTWGQRNEWGIGKLDRRRSTGEKGLLQHLVDLHQQGKVRTESGRMPPVLLTEFGYFNRSPTPDPSVVHTETTRERRFRSALSLVRDLNSRNRPSVPWVLVYHATENDPDEQAGDPNDYGLFARDGLVRGTRSYGKGGPQTRRAYCDGIRRWVQDQGSRLYPLPATDPGC